MAESSSFLQLSSAQFSSARLSSAQLGSVQPPPLLLLLLLQIKIGTMADWIRLNTPFQIVERVTFWALRPCL